MANDNKQSLLLDPPARLERSDRVHDSKDPKSSRVSVDTETVVPRADRETPNIEGKKRGPLFWIVLTGLCIAAVGWTIRFVHHSITFEETNDAYVTGHIHQISARVAGTVEQVPVEDNQLVKVNAPLVQLDKLEFEISLQRARAAFAQARAQEAQAQAAMDQVKAEASQAHAMVAQAQARVEQTGAQLDVANANFGRNQRLFDSHAVSKSDVDTMRSNAQASSAELDAAKANVEASRAKVQAADAAVASAQAQLSAAQAATASQEAAVRDAERELSYTTLVAPVEGRIGNKIVEVGNRVQVGQVLFALVSPEVWIMANFKETQLKKLTAGQPVEITIDALEGRTFTGKVDSISPASGAKFALLPPDNATGNFTKVVQRVPVKIVFDRESIRGVEDRLRPGLSTVVNVRIK